MRGPGEVLRQPVTGIGGQRLRAAVAESTGRNAPASRQRESFAYASEYSCTFTALKYQEL